MCYGHSVETCILYFQTVALSLHSRAILLLFISSPFILCPLHLSNNVSGILQSPIIGMFLCVHASPVRFISERSLININIHKCNILIVGCGF